MSGVIFTTSAACIVVIFFRFGEERRLMMIADVIRNATSEHEIYFLLTAYVEAVRFCDKLNDMSEHMASLPLGGVDDVRTRFNKLVAGLDAASKRLDDKACETIREALHIFGAALHRLGSLNAHRHILLENVGEQAA
jgi:hypothetical protein